MHVGCKMRQVGVARFTFAPASVEFKTQKGEFLDGWLTSRFATGKAISSGLKLGDHRPEQIDLLARVAASHQMVQYPERTDDSLGAPPDRLR